MADTMTMRQLAAVQCIPLTVPPGPIWVLPYGDQVPIQTFREDRMPEAFAAAAMYHRTTGNGAHVLVVVPTTPIQENRTG